MAEGQINSRLSSEVQRESCDTSTERFILEKSKVPFPKVPIQPESSQSARSFSSSSGNFSSPVFKPQRRRLRSECSDSEEDEKPVDSTSSDNKDASPEPFRRRANALERSKHKRKKVSAFKLNCPGIKITF